VPSLAIAHSAAATGMTGAVHRGRLRTVLQAAPDFVQESGLRFRSGACRDRTGDLRLAKRGG